jgi:hypothetical protein
MTMRYTPENLQRAFSLHYKKVFPVRGRILQILGFLLIWTGLLLLLLYRNQDQRIIQFVYIGAGVVLVLVHSWFIGRLGKATFKRMRSPQQTFDFAIDEEHIRMITDKGTYTINWDKISRAVIQDDVVLVYISKLQFYFFPKQYFRSPDDFEIVKSWTEAKVAKVIK